MKTPNKHFDMGRFSKILRRDFQTHYKGLLIGIGAIAALFTFFLVILPGFMGDPEPFIDEGFHIGGYLFAIFLGGLWFSSGIWSDMNNTQRRQHFFTIPASHLEKYLSKWLLSGPVFLLVATLAYVLFSYLINAFARVYPGIEYDSIDFGHEVIVKLLPYYLLFQPFYLLGGIWFGKFAFIKTSLVNTLLQVVYIAFISGLFYLLFSGFEGQLESNVNLQLDKLDQIGLKGFQRINLIFGLLTGLFFSYLGYVRLTERGA